MTYVELLRCVKRAERLQYEYRRLDHKRAMAIATENMEQVVKLGVRIEKIVSQLNAEVPQ